jgi:hypothetical protein
MKRWLLVLPLIAAAFVSWHFVHADESPITQCGPNRGHDCHCPRMVQRRRDAAEQACLMSSHTKEELDKCHENIPTLCEMVAHPLFDPETGDPDPDMCFKYCKYQGLCFCNDTRCDAHGDPLPQEPPKAQHKHKGH